MERKTADSSDMIPDYCNNRLNDTQKAEFESLLQEDDELMDACKEFQEFQELYHQIDPGEPTPSEALFDRISGNVKTRSEVDAKASEPVRMVVETVRVCWQRLSESITVPWMVVAAQAVVIVLLLAPAPQRNIENTYATLSKSGAPAVVGNAVGINVVFKANVLESDMRSLLQSIEGSVSGGPSREGRYVVSISNLDNLEKALQILKNSELVLFAEPVR